MRLTDSLALVACVALLVATLLASCATLRGGPREPEAEVLWRFPSHVQLLASPDSIYVWVDDRVTKYDLDDAGGLVGPIWTQTGIDLVAACHLVGFPGPQSNGRTRRPLALNQAHFTDTGLLVLSIPCSDLLTLDPATGEKVSKRRGRLFGRPTKFEVVERGKLKFWRDKRGTFWIRAGAHWKSAESAFFCQERVFMHRDGVARELDLQKAEFETIGEPIPIRGARQTDAFGLYRNEPRYLARDGYFSPDGFQSYFETDLGSLHAITERGLVFHEPLSGMPYYGTNLMPGFERCCSYDVLMSGDDPHCKTIPK